MRIEDVTSERCVPFSYLENPATQGIRIGGRSPVPPHYMDGCQKYFGTLEFEEGALSIFYSFDRDGIDPKRDIIDFNNQLLISSEMIHCVLHPRELRENSGTVDSVVSCHQLICGDERDDTRWDPEVHLVPYPRSKIGGKPFVDNISRCGDVFRRAELDGFRQLAQFDTPHPFEHSFVKRFPWDPGWLHVLYRIGSAGLFEFVFVIQQ